MHIPFQHITYGGGINLPPFSITRIYKIANSLTVKVNGQNSTTATICNSSSANLTAYGGAYYTWTPSPGQSAVPFLSNRILDPSDVLGSTPVTDGSNSNMGFFANSCCNANTTYTITVAGFDSYGNSIGSTAVNITILPAPTMNNITATPTGGADCPIQLTTGITGGLEYWWAPAFGLYDSGNSATINGSTVFASPQGNMKYKVIGLKTTGAVNCYRQKVINVDGTPLDFKFNLTGSIVPLASICGNDATNVYELTATDATGTPLPNSFVSWQKFSGGIPLLPIFGINPLQFSNTPCNYCLPIPYENEEWVMTFNPGGTACPTKRVYSLKVDPDVKAKVAKNDFCTNEMKVQITAMTPESSTYNYTWSPSTGLNNSTNQVVNFEPAVTPTLTTSYTFTVSATNPTGACSGAVNNSEVSFSISPVPYQGLTSLPTSPVDPITILQGSTAHIILDGGGVTGFTYSWSPGHGLSEITGTDVYATPLESITYTVNVNDIKATGGEYGCCNFFEVPVTVMPVSCVHGCISSIGCYLPNPFLLEVTPGFSYQWKKNGSNIAGATLNTYNISNPGNPSSFGVYSVVVSDGGNTVTINPFATIVAAPDISWCPQRLEENAIVDSSSGLIVYSNPSDGYFTLIANKFVGQDMVVEIYNTLGTQVYRKEFSSFSGATSIRLGSSKAEGLYIIRVISNKKSETAKMNINEIH